MIRVWDRPVRALHWALAASVVLGWATTEWAVRWHQPVGWAALAIVVLRTVWSPFGSRHARFTRFVRGPAVTLAYAARALRGAEPRHVGHNPLGAWMAVTLMACVVMLALTGWLYTTDRYFGDESVERMHVALAWGIVVLVGLHLAGVALASWRHRENLVAAMVHGAKREAEGSDID